MLYSELYEKSIQMFPDGGKTLDVQILMEAAFNLSRTDFWIKKSDPIENGTGLNKFYRYRTRLLKNEPVAHILKSKEFYGETFYVDKNVLVPRPETELLVEKAVQLIKDMEPPVRVLDIGAGSGVISIMTAKLTQAEVTAVEFIPEALKVLKKNIFLHRMLDSVTPLQADVFPPKGTRYHLILSNPPYIPEHEWQELDPTVKDYDPKTALAAGKDGMDIIRRIARRAMKYLTPDGKLLMEIGYNQREPVEQCLRDAKFPVIDFIKDYGGIDRFAFAARQG